MGCKRNIQGRLLHWRFFASLPPQTKSWENLGVSVCSPSPARRPCCWWYLRQSLPHEKYDKWSPQPTCCLLWFLTHQRLLATHQIPWCQWWRCSWLQHQSGQWCTSQPHSCQPGAVRGKNKMQKVKPKATITKNMRFSTGWRVWRDEVINTIIILSIRRVDR